MKELNIYNIDNIDILRAEYKKLEEDHKNLLNLSLNMTDAITQYFPLITFISYVVENYEQFEEIEEPLKWAVTTISIAAFNKEKELNKQWDNYRGNK